LYQRGEALAPRHHGEAAKENKRLFASHIRGENSMIAPQQRRNNLLFTAS
jgi:hypothetical protein